MTAKNVKVLEQGSKSIFTSFLLYYMRRDETDIFAYRNEGKVLIMDNPFAQTNAAHLLTPMMDMARKNNTQLISLMGLGVAPSIIVMTISML